MTTHNRVLIPVPLILRTKTFGEASSLLRNKTCLEDSDIDISMTREITIQAMRTLISQSAHEIILIWNDRDLERQIMDGFPAKLSRRIKSIYLTDIPSNFLSFFEPIYNEQICSPTLDSLINEIFLLYTACQERTEVDIRSAFYIINNWDNVFSTSSYLRASSDVLDLLSELKGLINLYNYPKNYENIECFVDTNQEIPIEKRIEDFLNDAYIDKLSKEKYYFGIPSHVRESIFRFRQLINNNILDKIELVVKPFFFANSPIELNIIKKQNNYYNPPISPLKEIYTSKINEYMSRNFLEKLYFIETMPTYRAGFRLYSCNGSEFNQSLVAEGLKFKGEYCLGGSDWIEINLSNSRIGNLVF